MHIIDFLQRGIGDVLTEHAESCITRRLVTTYLRFDQ